MPNPTESPEATDGFRDGRIVAAYLGTYVDRRARSAEGTCFGKPEQDAGLALLLARLTGTLSGTAAAVAGRELRDLVARLRTSPQPNGTSNLVLWSWLEACAALGETPERADLAAALELGGCPAALGGGLALAWHWAFLSRAQQLTIIDSTDVVADCALRLAKHLRALKEKLQDDPPDHLSTAYRTIFPIVATGPGGSDVRNEAETLFAVAVQLEQRRVVTEPILTAHLAQLLTVAHELGAEDASEWVRSLLIGTRHDADKHLLFQSDRDSGKYELSPWVPIALLAKGTSMEPIEDVLDPPAAEPPGFSIRGIAPDERGLTVTVEEAGELASRRFDEQDFNFLLDRVLSRLERWEGTDREPRSRARAHMILALRELLKICDDEHTAASIQEAISRSLDYMLREQEDNGGWSYSHQDKPSHVFTSVGATTTSFPDYQYTIDAAVPGIALALSYQDTRDPSLRDAAVATLGFFESAIGRTEWKGRPVWRLYPQDDKTPVQGTAVNYELWNGFFFASLLSCGIADADGGRRLRSYIEDSVSYAEGHVSPEGDVAYGDYVRELRTAYASWDAYLLGEIGALASLPAATDLSRRIVRRLEGLLFPSGAMPNVRDYVDHVEGRSRWTVHRHGIGPFPIRADYQLYLTTACASAGAAEAAGLRSLAFILSDLYEPGYGGIGAGYYEGRGTFDARAGVFARDWVVLSLAWLHRLAPTFRYSPNRRQVPRGAERLESIVRDALRDAELRIAGEHHFQLPDDHDGLLSLATALLRVATSGKAPEGTAVASAGGRVAETVDRAIESGLPEQRRELRQLLDTAWSDLFEPSGRGVLAKDGSQEMPADLHATYVLGFVAAATRLGMPGLESRARRTLRFFLHHYRRPGGAFYETRGVLPSPATSARVAVSLARILRLAPDFLDREGSTAYAPNDSRSQGRTKSSSSRSAMSSTGN